MENKKANQSAQTGKPGIKPAVKSGPTSGMSNAERKYKNSAKYKKLQQQKMIKKVSIISVIALVIIIICSVSGYFIYKSMYGHIMTFDGTKISIEDYKLVSIFNSGSTKQENLDVLTEYLVVEKDAAAKNVSLTESEIETAKADVQGIKDYILQFEKKAPKASEESYIRVLAIGNLYTRLQDLIKQDYVVDEDDFKTELANYIETGKQFYIDTQMKYVITETEEDAVFAKEMLNTGMEIDEVVATYSGGYNAEAGVERIPLSQLTSLAAEDVEKLLALKVSEVSDIINLGTAYAFFVIDEINIPDDAKIEEDFRETYMNNKVNTIFREQIEELKTNSDIVINQRAFDSIK